MDNQNTPETGRIQPGDFFAVDIRTGTIREARINPRARKPALILSIDFGELGIKTSSAQITENYQEGELIGRQVTAVVNFPPMRIAGVKSEVLVLAAMCGESGTVLLTPDKQVQNGCRIS